MSSMPVAIGSIYGIFTHIRVVCFNMVNEDKCSIHGSYMGFNTLSRTTTSSQPFELSYRIVGAQGVGKSDAYTTAVFDARFQRRVVVVHPELMDEALFKKSLFLVGCEKNPGSLYNPICTKHKLTRAFGWNCSFSWEVSFREGRLESTARVGRSSA